MRYLIVNADDFGRSPGVNRGVLQAHERGIVTSASLMVRWPAAAEAAAYCREYPSLSLGLHVDLGEWVFRDETWTPRYKVVPLEDVAAVTEEVARQLAAFRGLAGKDPTHLDSHQHVHLQEPVRCILLETGRALGIPVRHFSPNVNYSGAFYGQSRTGSPLPEAISLEGLVRLLAALPPGFTELGCHPGAEEDMDSTYRRQRTEELRALCHPCVREALVAEGIELRSFRDLAKDSSLP